METITIKIPEPEEVQYSISCLEEHLPVRGNAIMSDDADYDKEVEDKIIEELEYNQWAWCCVKVTGRWKGLEGTDYLGACSYSGEKEFMESSGYYENMKDRTYQEILQQLKEMQ